MTSRTLVGLLGVLLLPACANLNFFSESYEAELGLQAYREETAKYPNVTSGADYEALQRVGHRIAAASGKDYDWEFTLLEADVQNAFCLPGGKVAVYTGILPMTENEDGLAAVLGHEVAHATLRHGGQRMTRNALLAVAAAAVGAGLSYTEMNDGEKAAWLAAFGLGAQVGLQLPFSRDQEREADLVGLRYAIRAGYDPHEAVRLWERMAARGGGTFEWLSTHPDPSSRARDLEAAIPKLLAEEGRTGR